MGIKQKEQRDVYYKLAKELGYRSRSALKLMQIHECTNVLAECSRAVDLCASPGGFSSVLSRNMGPRLINQCDVKEPVLGIDLQPVHPIPGATFWTRDITENGLAEDILKFFDEYKVDIVVSDGAPDTLGSSHEDAYYQSDLVFNSLKLNISILKIGGSFVTKVYRTGNIKYVMYVLRRFFETTHLMKPQVCRQSSCEAFAVCRGFKLPLDLKDVQENKMSEAFWSFLNSIVNVPETFRFGMHRCGNSAYDADANYPELENSNGKRRAKPVIQLPIAPNYMVACQLKRNNRLSKIHQQ